MSTTKTAESNMQSDQPTNRNDDPPPAYGHDSPSSQVQVATDEHPPTIPTTEGYAPSEPMCSTPSIPKAWEIPEDHRQTLEKSPGCLCSTRGGCLCSDMGGFCFSTNMGCFFSDNKGCCFSDHAGCCFGDYGGCFCSGPFEPDGQGVGREGSVKDGVEGGEGRGRLQRAGR